MQDFREGVRRFKDQVFGEKQKLFEKLSGGQQPGVLLITCSDSRIVPNLLLQADPGEVFVLRTAGNVVPRYDALLGGEAATIEYAVAVLKVRDIIVCGHSHCGAVTGLLNPESLDALPAVRALLEHAAETKRRVDEKYADVDDAQQKLDLAIQQNVLVQLENLKTHPAVANALQEGRLALHGWQYVFESGEVYAHDAGTDQFAIV